MGKGELGGGRKGNEASGRSKGLRRSERGEGEDWVYMDYAYLVGGLLSSR